MIITLNEYEQKQAECWKKFWDEISSAIVVTTGVSDLMKERINSIFAQAFALGKKSQTLKIESDFLGNRFKQPEPPSQNPAENCDAQFGNILKDSSEDNMRLYIAAKIESALINGLDIKELFGDIYTKDRPWIYAKLALEYTDALIREAKKGGDE